MPINLESLKANIKKYIEMGGVDLYTEKA